MYDSMTAEVEVLDFLKSLVTTLKPEGTSSTRVQVVAKKSAVTWDKDFARAVLDKIVAFSR